MPALTMFEVTPDHPVPISPQGGTASVTVLSGDTLYYADTPQVSAANNQGSVTAGNVQTFTNPAWVRSASLSTVLAQIAAPPAAALLGSDGSVGGPGGTPLTGAVLTASPQSIQSLRVTVGPLPPASPAVNDLWFSTSWQDVRVSPSPNDRVQILTGSAAWEHNSIQEPLLWQDGTNWNLLYSQTTFGGGLGGLGWAWCPLTADPMIPSNWTKYASNPVIPPGGNVYGMHFGVYTEGATTYIYSPDSVGNVWVATCPSTPFTPTSLSAWTQVYARAGGINPINLRLFKVAANSYAMFYTRSVGSPVNWRAGVATATSPLGPFTVITDPINTLDPAVGGGGTDGPILQLEGGVYVGLFHATGVLATLPTDIYRATIPAASLTTDAWTILDNGLPFVARAASYEVDQVADINVGTAPNGVQLAVWDSFDNVAGLSSITMSVLSPVLKRYDGVTWRQAIPQSRATPLLGAGSNEAYGMGALTYNRFNFALNQGTGNSAFGTRALGANNTGALNTAFGSGALRFNTTASSNTAVGQLAALNTTTGSGNTALGSAALQANTTGTNSTAVGYQALNANTASGNTAVGQGAMFRNTTGGGNVAVGQNALGVNTTGTSNTAVGNNTLGANVTNTSNTAVGANALQFLTGGQLNNAVGVSAGGGASMTGSGCNYVGGNAGLGNTSGNENTAIGDSAGRNFSSGSNNVAVGVNTGYTDGTTATVGTISSATLIGERAQSGISNVIVLGKTIATRPNLYFGAAPTVDMTGGGVGVFHIANVVTAPATSPSGGGVLYVSAGALVYKGSSGTVTTIAVA